MVVRPVFIVIVAALGIAVGALAPEVMRVTLHGLSLQAQEPDSAKKGAEKHGDRGHAHRPGERHEEGPEGVIKISPERILAAQIELAPVGEGVLARRLTVPGVIMPDSNRIARVAAKVVGTVAQLNKQLGDPVAKDEVVAVLDSREVAEAKSEYLAAQVNFELQKTLFERAQPLYQAKVTPENQYLRTKQPSPRRSCESSSHATSSRL